MQHFEQSAVLRSIYVRNEVEVVAEEPSVILIELLPWPR